MEVQLAKAKVHSASLLELDPKGELVTPPPTKTQNADRTALASIPMCTGRGH